jgi:hypothetical protein
MSIRETAHDRTASRRRSLVKARTLVAVTAVTALTGFVIVAPAAFAAAPDTPGAPTATAGNGSITVMVTPAATGDPATSYAATCTADDQTTATGSDPSTTVVVTTGVKNGHSYTCTVIASNSGGDSAASPASNSVTPVAPTTVPDAPPAPSAAAGDARVTVTFSAPGSNGGLAISRYTITCTAQSDGTNIVKTSATVTPVTFFGLINGETYTCTVSAHNSKGDGPNSDPSNAVTPVAAGHIPDAPARPTVSAGDSQIRVNFVQPNNNGSAINSDTATCTSSNGGATGSNLGGSPSITVFGLTNGKSYTCTVFASNGLGDGPASPASLAAVPNGAPNAPPKPSVAGGDGRITVSFSPPGFNGGSPITGYLATCTSTDDGTQISHSGNASPIVITGLINGVTYFCNVTAFNANGPSNRSPNSPFVVPDRGPDTPARPAVAAGDAQIKVVFTAPGNGGSAILSYGAACTSSNGGHRSTKTGPGSPLVVTGLTNGRTYTCTVAARNARGVSFNSPASIAVVPTGPLSATAVTHGFRLFAGDGGVFTFGTDRNFGSAAGKAQHLVVGMTTTASEQGYWLVATDGGIFSFGDARFYGSTGAIHLNKPIVGMTPTPTGHGYWLVASDGGIFSYGDAQFYGSTGAIRLNQPIVGMAATPTGHGYWMVASDGGIFSFGDAHFFGSPVGFAQAPVVGMAPTRLGHGYWIAAADGSVFHFGDAAALGDATGRVLRLPVRGIVSTRSGRGYWLATGDGGVFTFGDAPFIGWPGPLTLLASIRGVSR